MSNEMNTAPDGCTLMAPGVAKKETRNGNTNYFVRCPSTGEWMFRHQKAFDQLLKRFDNDLEAIGSKVYSRAGKMALERENPELFAELFPTKVKKPSKPKAKKSSNKVVDKAKKALEKAVETPEEDEDPEVEVDDVDVEVSEDGLVEALEFEDDVEDDIYEDIYDNIDKQNLQEVEVD